ncbi:MAG: CocE/NonD family hydrolase, partial [Bacteroidales bacterium]|nr:CocE/NonD family hydrolase [Bacteroidales bacterium]
MIRKFIYFFLFIFVFGLISAQNKENISFLSYSVETSGGLMLATDIYLSDHNSIFPTILIRTPYNKANWKNTALQLTQLGYAVVVQDCRGKFESEGEFYAFKNEREDGIETIKWIKKQPWYNGKIAGYGSSYLGFTQWAVSDHLDAVCADFTGANIYDLIYPQGLFSLETSFNWGLANDARTTNSISPENIQKSYWHLPLSEADDSAYKDNPFVNDWLLHEKNDKYWHSVNHRGIAKGPVFSIAGWYDIFLIGQLNDFIAVDKKNAHLDNKIIITPWCHGTQSLENDYGGENKTGNTGALLQQFLAKTMLG